MDHVALEGSLRAANARVVAGQQSLREQRAQVRDLEAWGLDASLAKALLRIYEESHAVSILDRQRLYHALAGAVADPQSTIQDNDALPVADNFAYRLAA